jgi:hypothetical protein
MMKITFALALGKKNNATVIVDSNKYQTQMTESGNFTDASSIAQIAATKTATVDLVEEMNKPITEDKDAKVQVARDVLNYELDNLKSVASKKSNDPSLPKISAKPLPNLPACLIPSAVVRTNLPLL